MNELQVFKNQKFPEFGSIRTITENGKTLFCGKDVATALGYKSPKDAISAHCKGAVIRRLPTNGGEQDAKFITEGDIYRLAARSDLPGADAFESWIFDEVLPTIRKHGLYATDNTVEAILNDPDTFIKILQELKEERAKRKELEAENEVQRQTIADYEPIVHYVDTILESKDTMVTTQIASDYGMSAKRLNKILHEEGIQHKVHGQWILYRKYMGNGYTKSKTLKYTKSDGSIGTNPHTEWTQKGRLMIHEILTSRGIVAIMDRE